MAEEKQQSMPEGDVSEEAVEQRSPQENTHEEGLEADPASTEVRDELSEREVFAGDEDFYESLANSEAPKTGVSGTEDNVRAATEVGSVSPATSIPPQVPARRTRFSMLEKVLVVSIVAIGAMLLYAMLRYTSGSATENVRAQSNQEMLVSERPVENPVQSVPQEPTEKAREPETVLSSAQPLSLKVAQDFYLGRDYDKAYAAYAELHQNLAAGEENELLRDFLQLRMALCTKEAADFDQAGRLFGVVSESRSLAVRVVANYHLSLLEMRKRHYLGARTRAYQTITLIGAVDFDPDWALSVQRDCQFLVAEALTRNVLLLCDADKDLPEDLWMEPGTNGKSDKTDPFTDLNEEELRAFLSSGSDKLSKALLGPQIRKLENQSGPPRWSVVCNRASIEELLARFAANAGLDIQWAASETQAAHEAEDIVRNRAVYLHMPAVTSQQFVTAAVGSVGLLALLDDKGTASIYNPAAYTSLSNHVALLGKEAVSVWQRFLLAFHDDEYVPNAHFSLGLLHAQRDQLIDAVAEYRLVANRFSQASLAPFALLYSSKLKTDLHDYPGAREDLKQLVEQYPDAEFSGRACLYLADATMRAGLYDEAERLYRKVYRLGFSGESRAAAALGAGRCCYETEDHEGAAKWLTRYIGLAQDSTSGDLHLACFMLGRINLALGKAKQACDAFRSALAGQLTKEQQLATVSGLVSAYVQQENFVEALVVLEGVRPWQFSEEEFAQMLVLKADVLRSMGLVDKAIAILGDRAQYWSETELKGRLSFELAKCYIAKGDLELARKNLSEIFVLVEPGSLANEVALELADVCLKLGQDSQTIPICCQLLDSEPSTPVKQRALLLLAKAYRRQGDYDKAARALSGRWDQDEARDRKGEFASQTDSGW